MKKISLKSLNLKEVEQLTREQLKNVIGGYTGGTGDVTDDGGTSEEKFSCPTTDCLRWNTSTFKYERDFCTEYPGVGPLGDPYCMCFDRFC